MADIAPVADENPSPTQEELVPGANGAVDARGIKRPRLSTAEDDEDDEEKPGRERRKIEIKFIQDKSRRHITFSKRKAGIMKKVSSLLSAFRRSMRLETRSIDRDLSFYLNNG